MNTSIPLGPLQQVFFVDHLSAINASAPTPSARTVTSLKALRRSSLLSSSPSWRTRVQGEGPRHGRLCPITREPARLQERVSASR
jgi:hypothetical protein